MPKKRPLALTIAGYDPSGGAGILADIKTFEQHKVQAMAVCTANTIQTEDSFLEVNWIEKETVIKQLTTLLNQYKFEFCKIGLIHNLEFLLEIIKELKKKNPTIKIIWDPIFSASAGFEFYSDFTKVGKVLKELYLFTPNWLEVEKLNTTSDVLEVAKGFSKQCNTYLKGGHNTISKGKDYLFMTNGKSFTFNPKKVSEFDKHGTGCILSAALTANLLHDFPIVKACLRSKDYVSRVLESNKTLLGYHKF